MKRKRKSKTNQRRRTKSELEVRPPKSKPTWQSVIVEAEEQMAALRRTIELTKEHLRSRRQRLVSELEAPLSGTAGPRWPLVRASDN